MLFSAILRRFRKPAATPEPKRAMISDQTGGAVSLMPQFNSPTMKTPETIDTTWEYVRPPLAAADAALVDETPTIEADLELVFAEIRAREAARDHQRRVSDGDFLMAMGLVEKFIYENMDFGPGRTHNISVGTAASAFEAWRKQLGFAAISKPGLARAMMVVMEWQGCHKANHSGKWLYIGAKLRDDFAVQFAPRNMQGVQSKTRLGMGLAELSRGQRLN